MLYYICNNLRGESALENTGGFNRMKKRMIALAAAVILIISAIALTSCGGTTLTGEIDENGKAATYTASKADDGDFVLSGTLIVTDDEQITIDSQLEKGSMKFEFISSEGLDDGATAPDTEDLDAAYTANLNGTESQAVWFGAGEYMVRATVTEGGTTGTVNIEVKGFGEAGDSETAE